MGWIESEPFRVTGPYAADVFVWREILEGLEATGEVVGRDEVVEIGWPPLSGPVWMLVHDRSLVHRGDGFCSRRAIAQFTVRPLRIVMAPPLFDDDLSLLQGVENLAV